MVEITWSSGSSELPETFQFVVTDATGLYAYLEGTGGALEIKITPAGQDGGATFEMRINVEHVGMPRTSEFTRTRYHSALP